MIYGGCFYEPQALKFFSLMDIELFDSWKCILISHMYHPDFVDVGSENPLSNFFYNFICS